MLQNYSPIINRKPAEVIAYYSDEQISVEQFLNQAVALSRKLPSHLYIINLLTDRYQYLLVFCASIIAGQCTLMPPNRLENTLDLLSRKYPDSYSFENSDLAELKIDLLGHEIDEIANPCNETPQIPSDQLCAIAFTSGSTGDPTPNLKYWETLRTGSLGNAELLLSDQEERINMVATVPPQHMWGLETSILLPLFADVAISHLTPFYPQDIAAALKSVPEPRVLISSPVHLNVLLKSGVQLVKLDRVFSATAPASIELAQQIEQRFSTQFLEIFGCSESGIFARRLTATESIWQLSDLFELEVKWDRTSIIAEHLPEVVILQDVVETVAGQRFRWLGRHQDMINIAGKRGSLADLNRRLLAIKGVLDGVVFMPDGSAKRLVAMVVAPGLKPADILNVLKSGVESVFLPRPVYMVSALPRQETGKLIREDMLKLYQDVAMKSSGKQ